MPPSIANDIRMTSGFIEDLDPEISSIINLEEKRQRESIILSPTINYTSRSVLDTLQTVLQNKYSEGYPGARYYGGNENVDNAERLAQKRALDLFNLNDNEWNVNVQPLTGNIALFQVLTALITPKSRIMTPDNNYINNSSIAKYFNILTYNENNINQLADNYKPNIIISGNGIDSSYNNTQWNYQLIGDIAKSNNSYHLSDISDVAGLIVSDLYPSPFNYSDVVVCSPFATLRGPRGAAMIFYRKQYESQIDGAVFPGHQGGPHNHAISAMATALKMAKTDEFVNYQDSVMDNIKSIESTLKKWKNINIINNGTHCISISGLINSDMLYNICNKINIDIYYNPNTKEFRLSSNAMTTRGLNSNDFVKVVDMLKDVYNFSSSITDENDKQVLKDIDAFKKEINDFATQFPLVGIDD